MNNTSGTKTAWPTVLYVLLFAIMYFLTYTDILPLKIGNAAPMPMVAVVVAVAFFYGEWSGFAAGLLAGTFADAVASGSVCFNMIVLSLIGLIAGLIVQKYLNKNVYSALILSLGAAIAYFFFHWLVFYLFSGFSGAARYLLLYSLPSAVYTAFFILPAYLPGRYLK